MYYILCMVSVLGVGSSVIISFQTKFPTFSVVEFASTLEELEYAQAQQQIDLKTGKPTSVLIYRKQDIQVDADLAKNILNFRILNTIKIDEVYDEITKTLVKLHVEPKSINLMGIDCKTRAHEVGNPEHNLTALIDKNVISQLSKTLDFDPGIVSIVLANKNPQDEDLQIRIEPLNTNPTESYFVHLNYKTQSHEKFNAFISKFGPSLIEDLVEVLNKNAETN